MKPFPILIDSRPPYLRGGESSLLLMPIGAGTLVGHIDARVSALTAHRPLILTSFEPSAAYEEALRKACPRIEGVVAAGRFEERLSGYEPSDHLLLADPSCFPEEGLDAGLLMNGHEDDPRWVRHLVALDTTAAGTREFVHADADGRIRRIQRYYDSVTWPFASGVSCSLLPVASTFGAGELPFGSLPALRRALASAGVPSRDVPLPCRTFDLTDEGGLLGLSERFVLDMLPPGAARRIDQPQPPSEGNGCTVHPSARILGPVVLHDGVAIEEEATVIGPALVGAGSRIRKSSTVAQCLVTPGTVVPEGTSVRHRVLSDQLVGGATREGPPAILLGPSPRQRLAPVEMRDHKTASSAYAPLKGVLDRVVAGASLLLLSPLLLLIAALIRLGSRGPILYGDVREGKDGKVFRCWKFRTMYLGAAARQRELYRENQLDGPQFKLDRDPRVTPIGRLLRPTSLDELPQLINVVMGEMSLVGPRPSPFRENQVCVPWREGRLSVRPGITGLWQVCRHDRAAGDFHQWIYYDLLYVQHMSLALDLKIIAATLWTLGGKWSVPLSRMIPDADQQG